MAVYVDKPFVFHETGWKKGKWCHMWADTEDELHEFAAHIGLHPEWSQVSHGISGDFIHYDLRMPKRQEALRLGAIEKPLKEHVAERLELIRRAAQVELTVQGKQNGGQETNQNLSG